MPVLRRLVLASLLDGTGSRARRRGYTAAAASLSVKRSVNRLADAYVLCLFAAQWALSTRGLGDRARNCDNGEVMAWEALGQMKNCVQVEETTCRYPHYKSSDSYAIHGAFNDSCLARHPASVERTSEMRPNNMFIIFPFHHHHLTTLVR